MKSVIALVLFALLSVPVAVSAHEGHMHKALGTIATIQGDLVEVKTTDPDKYGIRVSDYFL